MVVDGVGFRCLRVAVVLGGWVEVRNNGVGWFGWSSSLVCFGLFGDVRSKRGVQEAQAQKNRKEKEARE